MSWLVENPLPTIVFCLVLAGIFITAFFKTRRPVFLWGVIGAAVLLGIGLWIESAVVTEREEVEQTIEAAAQALEDGDANRLLSLLDPDAARIRGMVELELGRRNFETATAKIERIDFTRSSSPVRARVILFGKVEGRNKQDNVPNPGNAQNLQAPANARPDFIWPGRLEVWLYQTTDGWIIDKVENFGRGD